MQNKEKNPYDIQMIGVRTEHWKTRKLSEMAKNEKRSINGMINRWIDREIRKWERKHEHQT